MFVMNERAEVNRLARIDSRVIGPKEIAELVPAMSFSPDAVYPVMGALYHPPGGIIRHDAVVWGYARGADRRGVQIHPHTRVTGIRVTGGQVEAVETDQGTIRTGTVLNATAGWCSTIARMAGSVSRSSRTRCRRV